MRRFLGLALLIFVAVAGWRIGEILSTDALGMAFQIADDLLDVHSDAATMGKATLKDAGLGKLTYPGLLGLEGAQRELQQAH